jgi:hypothetical protein
MWIDPDALRAASALDDERRGFRRIDDRVLLDYGLIRDGEPPPSNAGTAAHDEAIHTLLTQSTAEVLSRSASPELAALTPWLIKMDWMMELMLKTLRRMANDTLSVPRLTDVNISASGIRFASPRQFAVGDRLALEVILPPFVPIRVTGHVIHVVPLSTREERYLIGAQFIDIKADDRECLIRHILQVEAERLRARRAAPDPGS